VDYDRRQGNLFPGIVPSARVRMLWESTHKARRHHYCDHCNERIERGNVYRREVMIMHDGRLMVFAYHESPDCPIIDMDFEEPSEIEALEVVAIEVRMVAVQKVQINGEIVTEYESQYVPTIVPELEPGPQDDNDDDIAF
jgi:hypothetical protein